MSQQCEVNIQYFPLPMALRKYCTTTFLCEINVPDGEAVEDLLFPEWATIRFFNGGTIEAVSLSGERIGATDFPVTGPSTEAVRFRIGSVRQWGFSLHPLGWKKLVGQPAENFANALRDGHQEPAFSRFLPLARSLFAATPDPQAELQRIIDFLRDIDDASDPHEPAILEIFIALLDPKIASVGQLVEKVGMSRRTLERICKDSFGFSPKMLLRRQRFMRSLTHYTVDPSLKWIGAIDATYHDQAQFVRDFRKFMGMTPSNYGELAKPVLSPVMRERDRFSREMVRSLRLSGDNQDYGVTP